MLINMIFYIFVQILRKREQELASDLERLSKEKMANQQRLTILKKELMDQWGHININKLLPNTLEAIKPTRKYDFIGILTNFLALLAWTYQRSSAIEVSCSNFIVISHWLEICWKLVGEPIVSLVELGGSE